jgi:hypothetical protein
MPPYSLLSLGEAQIFESYKTKIAEKEVSDPSTMPNFA